MQKLTEILLVQLELEQDKDEEEQENTPEFVKMKSNLRRTKQEVDGQERATQKQLPWHICWEMDWGLWEFSDVPPPCVPVK